MVDAPVEAVETSVALGGQEEASLPTWTCPEHASAPPGASSPDQCTCDPGFYALNAACYLCSAGFYCPEGSNYRQACPANAISDVGAFLRTECVCKPGFYGIAGGACTACEFATFCPGEGVRHECPAHALSVVDSPRTSKLHCICDAGYYGENGEPCRECRAGSACPGGSIKIECAYGTYSPVNGSSECLSCPPASTSNPQGTGCELRPCPVDAVPVEGVKVTSTTTGRDLCACVDRNTFYMIDVVSENGEAWVECKSCALESCPPGEFSYGCGDACETSPKPQGECFKCPAGKYAEPAAECNNECSGLGRQECDDCMDIECDPGFYLTGCGASNSGNFVPCENNTYASERAPRTGGCTECGILDACGIGQVLTGCGFDSQGTCTNCATDEFSYSDGTIELLDKECRRCEVLSCPVGSYRYGCGTAYDEWGAAMSSSEGKCLKCPAGKYTPANTAYDSCAECPRQSCPGEAGTVYLDGCFGRDPGDCKDVTCSTVDTRSLCSIPIDHTSPKLAGAVKVAGGQDIDKLNPSDTDAFGSSLAWVSMPVRHGSSASSPLLSNILAVGAARDTSASATDGPKWRVGLVYLLRVSPISLPATPPAVPMHLANEEDVQVSAKLNLSHCGFTPENGDAFGFAMAGLGDLDGDGISELAVAAPYRASPHFRYVDAGVVCIFFLNEDMSVKKSTALSLETMGGAETDEIVRMIGHSSRFGCAVSALGDVNGDGVNDMAVSACGVDNNAGALLVLHLKMDGQVLSASTISGSTHGPGNLTALVVRAAHLSRQGPHSDSAELDMKQFGFGVAVSAIGDVDGDGFVEVGVTVASVGALVIIRLTHEGAIQHVSIVSDATGALLAVPTHAISGIGDVNGDATDDLLLGGDGSVSFLTGVNSPGTMLLGALEIREDEMFEGLDVTAGSYFGKALAVIRDVNGDGAIDVAIGAFGQESSSSLSSFKGGLYIAQLRGRNGVSVKM